MKDNAYVAARDALIPEAERRAKERIERENPPPMKFKGRDGVMTNWSYFTAFFIQEMDKLARQTGLIK